MTTQKNSSIDFSFEHRITFDAVTLARNHAGHIPDF